MKNIALFEIALVILSIAAFSYMLDQTDGYFVGNEDESFFVKSFRNKFIQYFSGNLVSAQEGLWTCLQDNNGAICQEYPASTCNQQCNGACFPGAREDYLECRLGTCIDTQEGTCAPNSPQSSCVDSGGLWKDQSASELAECRPGCCLFNDQAQFLTENACNVLGQRLGFQTEYRIVENEVACLNLANSNDEGACLLGDDGTGRFNCRFLTKSSCLTSGGEFHSGLLCSNEALNTVCEKQSTTSCVDGKDEVYWFDSCGNQENIYSSDKDESWNNGRVLAKEDSCFFDDNQAECGNCNYLAGSICGTKRAQDAAAEFGDFVCRDLSCVDEGVTRKHGESWCAFDSQIGVDGTGNGERSVDLPGSRHYRKSCINGEVTIEPCADARGEVCQESRDEEIDFSSAACRINQWQVCAEANTDKESLDKCETYSGCFLKEVRIDRFSFDVCAPKHPPGFDLDAAAGGEVGESLCSLASQKCTVIYQKGLGGWKCKQNCACRTAGFTETMNNLCMSLGDCGAGVNIQGDYTEDGYRISGAPKLNQNYINNLKKYTEPKEGQKVDPLTQEEIASLYGLDPEDPNFDIKIGQIIGLGGAGALGVAYAVGAIAGPTLAPLGSINYAFAQFGAYGNAFGAVAAGAAIGYLVAKLFGLTGEAELGLVVVGVATGGILSGLSAAGIFGPGGLAFSSILIWTAVVVVIVALIFKFLGIGKTKKVIVTFTCNPWQPPIGGNKCGQCGNDGLPCSKYKCQSLGQTCGLINEGTSDQECVNLNPNDGSAPLIKPNEAVKSENIQYTSITNTGFNIQGQNGCIPAFTQIQFGITLNEPAQCKVDTQHTSSYDNMEFFFAGSNLFKQNHTMLFNMPSLNSVSNEEGIEIDTDQDTNFNLYVRCMDANGNKNVNEYAINFCLTAGPDRTAPVINRFNPETPAYSAYGASEKEIEFFVNEPAECKWSKQDRDYDIMENQAVCDEDIEDGTLFGWRCETTLPLDSNRYYFRCKDQPFETNQSLRNKNSQSSIYEITRSESPLTIIETSPNGEILTGNLPVSVDLEVQTSGGHGNRFCEFNFGGGFIRFFESGTDTHQQNGLNLYTEGDYNLGIRCQDDAGNTASSSINFNVEVDNVGPKITRVYEQGGLNVITNEPATCAYSFSNCNFNFNNSSLMSGQGLVHTSEFDPTKTHYIKCRDNFENPGSCLAVRAGFF